MRFARSIVPLCAALWLVPLAGRAQQTTPAALPEASNSLAIPLPPGATVQVEMDASDDYLWGMVKSLLRGVNGQAIMSLASAAAPKTKSTGATPPAASPAPAPVLSDATLADVLKNVSHVHMIVVQLPGAKPIALAAAKLHKAAATPAAAPAVFVDQMAFYETAYRNEGGRRILYVNTPDAHVVMVSFGHAHGFAMVVQSPDTLTIVRADGYPNLEPLSSLGTAMTSTLASTLGSLAAAIPPDATPPTK